MMKAAKQISFTVTGTLLLILMISLCISLTAISQEKQSRRAETEYYRALEKEYVKEVRTFLDEKGYTNSGVTMTERVEADGTRSYTVTIHHGKMQTLTPKERGTLLQDCRGILFADGSLTVSHKFLETDL